MDQLMELRPIRFAQVPNEAVDTLPDLNSIGLLTTMLRHAPGYRFTVGDVIAQKRAIPGPKLGKSVAYGAMATLIAHRWAARIKYMCAGGHFHTALFRTATRFTDEDLRTIAHRFTEGTEMVLYCKGCSNDPEIPVRTILRSGATMEGPWGSHELITTLLAPGGRLSGVPVAGKPETGTSSTEDASSQVAPVSGKPEVGAPEVGKAETFNKTREEHSSSSGGAGVTPDPVAPAEEEEDESPSAGKRQRRGRRAVDVIIDATGATAEEAELVVERITASAAERGVKIGLLRRYVARFEPEDLTHHLDAVRAQRASEGRTEVSVPAARCSLHQEPLDCPVCASMYRPGRPAPVLASLLREHGPDRRPDLARILGEPVGA
mgnify:CR=1 FL=1